MNGTNDEDVFIEDSQKETKHFFAAACGLSMGGLTFAAGPLALLSANPVIAAIQFVLTMLLFPGLLCAAMVGSLVPAAFINGFFYLGISWLLFTVFAGFKRRAKARR